MEFMETWEEGVGEWPSYHEVCNNEGREYEAVKLQDGRLQNIQRNEVLKSEILTVQW